ncbi:MAG: histidine phosphatase family protein, partial [Chloroflexota bacterium]
MRLILVRHGQTQHNADGLVQGRADIPLSELGQRQG